MNTPAAAFFDVDGTILEGNVVRYFVNLRTWEMPRWKKLLWMAAFLVKIPCYIVLDLYSRDLFSRMFYRNYRRLTPEQLRIRADPHFEQRMKPHIYPASLDQIREHQQRGEPVVLITNSLEPLVEPLVRLIGAAALVGARLRVESGRFTGSLEGGPLTDRKKAEAVAAFGRERQLDLSQCYAYADSLDDLPMLEAVGHPVVVNPPARLRGIARRRGWRIASWEAASSQGEGS